jgi:uncharacterized protein
VLSNALIERLVEVCCREGAEMVALYGSAARGEETADSDLDLLVRFRDAKSLVSFARLERHLSEIAGRPVDLVTEGSLSRHIRPHVLAEMKVLYAA